MRRTALLAALVSTALVVPASVLTAAGAASGAAGGGNPESPAYRGPELSAATRLADRRSLVVGDRYYEMGDESGLYPATGFHTRGEMGGFWTPPIKLLDGIWFDVDGTWRTASRYTNGWGYQRMDLGSTASGVRITRTDFAPDGVRAGLIGLRFSSSTPRTVSLTVDAHSELMKAYPWGETKVGDQPFDQSTYNLPDTVATSGKNLLFREDGTPAAPPGAAQPETHHYAALVGSSLTPTSTDVSGPHRGPQGDIVCPTSNSTDPQPDRCDDTAYGKGAGGGLTYSVDVPAGGRTVWFAVSGSDQGVAAAQAAHDTALAHPDRLLARTVRDRLGKGAWTRVSLPGDRLLQRSVAWSKENLLDSVQSARNLHVRRTNAGTTYGPVQGTVKHATWYGAGFPDYPWLFATDGEYTAFAAVAAGQFGTIKSHMKALRDVSVVANDNSGKVVHEVTPDGSVYFGANNDAGNTDETAKFPSIVALIWRWTGDTRFRDAMYPFAKRNMRYIYRRLDVDKDGWPEGLGNVERPGMGEEKLDNTVYTIRGLRDLADLAASRHDGVTRRWATSKADSLQRRFDKTWWYGPAAQQYADSLDDPGNEKVFQRHWIGVTPVEAELKMPNGRTRPLAPVGHARKLVANRETPCYTGTYGLFHTGTGATTDPDGNKGATCDSATSSVQSERSVFTLNTSIMAVAEAALGRLGPHQSRFYSDGNATVQLDPSVWELPGGMPEIAPSPDFTPPNIDRKFTERSMAQQAWGAYGTLWPVVHYELGLAPDIGRGRFSVVPQVPAGQPSVAGRSIRLGTGKVGISVSRGPHRLTTVVRQDRRWRLTIGAVLPSGARVTSVRLDGHRARFQVVRTSRGREVLVNGGRGTGLTRLVVSYR
jgi:hypothetical protein